MATVRKEVTTTTVLTFEIEIDESKYGKRATKSEFKRLAKLYARGDDADGVWFNPLEEDIYVEIE